MALFNFTAEGINTDGTTQLTTTNQGASGDVVTPVKSGSGSLVGTATAGEFIIGTKSVKAVTTSSTSDSAYIMFNTASPTSTGVRAYFRLSAAPTVDMTILTVYSTSGAAVNIKLRTDGRFRVNDSAGSTAVSTASSLTFPAVFAVDLAVQLGTTTTDGKAKFQVFNSASATTPFDSITEITAGNFSSKGTTIASVRAGKINSAEAQAVTMFIDAFKQVDGYSLVGANGANIPPVVTPSAAQSVQVGTQFTVSASATDGDGTIASLVPTQTSGPTLALTGSGNSRTATPTVPGIYQYTWTATDDQGATSTGISQVTVFTFSSAPTSVASPGGYTAQGAADIITALSDGNASTGAKSSSNPASADVLSVNLPPFGAGAATINFGYFNDIGSPVRNLRVSLFMGSTEVAFTTVSNVANTAEATGQLVLTDTQNQAWTDRSASQLRFSTT